MAEAERQSAPETTPAPTPSAPGGGVAALAPSYGDVTSLVGALAAGPDDWRADVVNDMQRTSGNRAVMRMLDLDGPLLSRAPTAQAAKKKTGIAAMTGKIAAGSHEVQDDWAKLKTPSARAKKVAQASLNALKAAGVPAYRVVVKNLGGDLGSFDFTTWTMELDSSAFAGKKPNDNAFAEAADTIAHESRHCEQWFRMARLRAGQRKSAQEIATELGIPKRIADAAKRKPLKGTSPEANEAKAWYESVYGKKADHRDKVLTDLDNLYSALEQAQRAYDTISGNPNVNGNQLTAASTRLRNAQRAYERVYKQYRGLPEEADAWSVGGDVGRRVRKLH